MVLRESSLSRVYSMVLDPDRIFAIISAYRSELGLAENKKRHAQLAQDIRDLGLGYVMLNSGWVEDDKPSEEQSYFIPNIQFNDALELSRKYNQYGMLYKSKDKGFILVKSDTGEQEGKPFMTQNTVWTIRRDDLAKAWSSLVRANKNARNAKFTFLNEKKGGSMIDAYHEMMEKEEIWISVLNEEDFNAE